MSPVQKRVIIPFTRKAKKHLPKTSDIQTFNQACRHAFTKCHVQNCPCTDKDYQDSTDPSFIKDILHRCNSGHHKNCQLVERYEVTIKLIFT